MTFKYQNKSLPKAIIELQGIPAFRDFTIRDPRYFVILFQWKLAKKVDFRKFLKVRFLLVLFYN